VLGVVLAGGEGKRLLPLTADRAKPAVPFGGQYRLVDFVLSNLVNAGFLKLCVLTQYKSHSLDRHITTTWRMSTLLGNYVTPVPAQQRLGPRWYTGSADAIFQSLNLVYDEQPEYVLVFGADHVYRMDPGQMLDQHIEHGAGVTVAGLRVPRSQASAFGVIETEPNGRDIVEFHEKPVDPPCVPGDPDISFASMGNYIFNTDVLIDALRKDADDEASMHDMGGDIIPMLTNAGMAQVYDFSANDVPGATDRDRAYWRDVGTLDSYHDAHMDLVSVHPVFNLYNQRWPIYSLVPPLPPAKFVEGGEAHESIVAAGSIISGGLVDHSVVAFDVRIGPRATVIDSVLLPGAEVGAGAVVRRAILDKNVVVEEKATLGVDLDRDRELYTVSAGGVVVLGKNSRVSR
jgi:glucose-1-phosphate adenylyltransferase